ncbi:acyl-CoA dehydrogenase family protein [Bradyrhizobium sp. RDT10]
MSKTDDGFSIMCETLSRFVKDRLIPREKEINGLDRPPDDLISEVRNLGLFGLTYPEQYGGLGLNTTQEVEVGFILGRTTPAMRNFISIHNGVAGQAIVHGATLEQKARYLPRLASGEMLAAFALTEPDTGSDARGITTHAFPSGGGWLI